MVSSNYFCLVQVLGNIGYAIISVWYKFLEILGMQLFLFGTSSWKYSGMQLFLFGTSSWKYSGMQLFLFDTSSWKYSGMQLFLFLKVHSCSL